MSPKQLSSSGIIDQIKAYHILDSLYRDIKIVYHIQVLVYREIESAYHIIDLLYRKRTIAGNATKKWEMQYSIL